MMASTVAFMWRGDAFADEDLYADLGAVIAGRKPGRESDHEVIVFSPTGLGLRSIVGAQRVYGTALSQRLGQWLTL